MPRTHWLLIRGTSPLQRLIAQVRRRIRVVGFFPEDAAATRLVCVMLLRRTPPGACGEVDPVRVAAFQC